MNAFVEAELNELKQQIPAEKYNKAGIYCIKVDDWIMYVGKAKNMRNRIATHMRAITNEKAKSADEEKYVYLRESVLKEGNDISFDVLQECAPEDLLALEHWYINKYEPILNKSFPKVTEEDYEVIGKYLFS